MKIKLKDFTLWVKYNPKKNPILSVSTAVLSHLRINFFSKWNENFLHNRREHKERITFSKLCIVRVLCLCPSYRKSRVRETLLVPACPALEAFASYGACPGQDNAT
jgi:hypothetical protein